MEEGVRLGMRLPGKRIEWIHRFRDVVASVTEFYVHLSVGGTGAQVLSQRIARHDIAVVVGGPERVAGYSLNVFRIRSTNSSFGGQLLRPAWRKTGAYSSKAGVATCIARAG